jgi:hypothetical protein
VSDNDAEGLLPVALFDKVIKTTITQAAGPVTREDVGTAYKAAIPYATVTSHRGAMPWEGGGTGVITPEACVTVCLAVLEVIPDKVEGTRRGTSCQVAGGFEERASRGHPTPARPQHHGGRARSSTHILLPNTRL